jgi:hypothetical protein
MPPENKKPASQNSYSAEEIVSRPQTLRTFSSDMAEAVRSGEASVVKIALAEQKKKTQEYENFSPKSTKNKFFITASSILVGLGLLALAYFVVYPKLFTKTVDTAPTQNPNEPTSIIFADVHKGFDITGLLKEKVQTTIKNEINNQTLKDNGIADLYFITESNGKKSFVGTSQFFTAVGSSIPGRALRALAPTFMLGIFKGPAPAKNQPFILLNTTTFDSTYAGLLEWESDMVDDFFIMWNIPIGGERNYLLTKDFQDSTFKNLDVRMLLDKNGSSVLMYGFINKDTVLITTTQDTFAEIANRYNSSHVRK